LLALWLSERSAAPPPIAQFSAAASPVALRGGASPAIPSGGQLYLLYEAATAGAGTVAFLDAGGDFSLVPVDYTLAASAGGQQRLLAGFRLTGPPGAATVFLLASARPLDRTARLEIAAQARAALVAATAGGAAARQAMVGAALRRFAPKQVHVYDASVSVLPAR
jgi:hypothetical protein